MSDVLTAIRSPNACPRCGARGKKLSSVTLRSLLTVAARARLQPASQHRFCRTLDCDVVWFAEDTGDSFTTREVMVVVFQKSTDVDRPVCYCFDHSVADVEMEARAGEQVGAIAASIEAACSEGRHACREKNPQGGCCLGNIRALSSTSSAVGAGCGCGV